MLSGSLSSFQIVLHNRSRTFCSPLRSQSCGQVQQVSRTTPRARSRKGSRANVYAADSTGSVIVSCEHTGVGGVTSTTTLPPPFGDTRSLYAVGSHWRMTPSPGPGTSREKRALAAAALPGCRTTITAFSASGFLVTCVGRFEPLRARSCRPGIAVTKHVALDAFRRRSLYEQMRLANVLCGFVELAS